MCQSAVAVAERLESAVGWKAEVKGAKSNLTILMSVIRGVNGLKNRLVQTAAFDPGCVETLAEFRYDGRAGFDGWFFGFGYLSG
jgi:hypothetical protein